MNTDNMNRAADNIRILAASMVEKAKSGHQYRDCYDIRFDLTEYYGGLHCGDCLEVFTRGKWKPARMEYGNNWYLTGIRTEDLNGLLVRI